MSVVGDFLSGGNQKNEELTDNLLSFSPMLLHLPGFPDLLIPLPMFHLSAALLSFLSLRIFQTAQKAP